MLEWAYRQLGLRLIVDSINSRYEYTVHYLLGDANGLSPW